MKDTHKKFQGAEKIKRLLKWQPACKDPRFYALFSPKKKWRPVGFLGVWQSAVTLDLPDF